MWSPTQRIPILLRSFIAFKLVPGGLPVNFFVRHAVCCVNLRYIVQDVRWLPVNVAVEVVYKEIQAATTTPTQSQLLFYSLENAVPIAWASVAGTLAQVYALPITPAAEWAEQIRKRTEHPANKLLAFFEENVQGSGVPALQLYRAREAAGDLVDYMVDED